MIDECACQGCLSPKTCQAGLVNIANVRGKAGSGRAYEPNVVSQYESDAKLGIMGSLGC